ncbi:peptidase M20 [Streptomyces coelicoflavus ZG0656]|nr:peptidase M20 [Streptomyces coelicoflavus ZG0656]MZE49249.1 M20/M25/M40 family metallo-hydrolase [Streptomyces sp. SID5477]
MLDAEDISWLMDVMAVDTVSPLEGGEPGGLAAAQDLLEAGALSRGFETSVRLTPDSRIVDDAMVPAAVCEAARRHGPGFFEAQPSLLLGIGRAKSPARTMVVNFHMDTVGPHLPPRLQEGVLHGRGAVDDKGPGLAAVAGIARAFAEHPGLHDRVHVLVMSVPAEEGGALGTYGTRFALREGGIEAGLLVVAEPTSGRFLDCASAAMTPEITVTGRDSTDDHPYEGTNATLALSHAALTMTHVLAPVVEEVNAKLCVSGLTTGAAHNRVYGSGSLKFNIAYYDDAARTRLEREVEAAFTKTAADFRTRWRDSAPAGRIAESYEDVVRLNWLKRGYPALANRHPALETVLNQAGLHRHEGAADGSAFTCDAIWASEHCDYAVVCGPGDLDLNGAHTDAEYVRVEDLASYSARMERLVLAFAEYADERA